MGYGLALTTAPVAEPVTLAEAKSHLNVAHNDDDNLITRLIQAAREQTETETDRRWMSQTVTVTLMRFPISVKDECCYPFDVFGNGSTVKGIALPFAPVSAINAVRYYDEGSTLRTLAANTDYLPWLSHLPPLIFPAPGKYWPLVQSGRPAAVEIECVAGYANAFAVPAAAKSAMLLAIGYWYEHRGDSEDPTEDGLPAGAKRLRNQLSIGSY